MTAGLPGTGIGGLFYLVTAIFMPVREAVRTVKGRSNRGRWRFVLREAGFSSGIIAGMWLMGWCIKIILGGSYLQTTPFLITVAILAMILAVVEMVGLFLRRRPPVQTILALPVLEKTAAERPDPDPV